MKELCVQEGVLLKDVSTFGIGGVARRLVIVGTPEELVAAVQESAGSGFRIFAGGSNIVFPDGGVTEPLICIRGGTIEYGDLTATVDAGVPLAELIAGTIERGWSGLETLSGIPGTIGGAVYGNAGAYGRSIAEAVERVEVLAPQSGASQIFERRWVPREECGFAYRESVFKKRDWILLRVELKLARGDAEELQKKSREIIETREKKYRPGLRCPGSFFKNVLVRDVGADVLDRIDRAKIIEGKIPAGYLLEEIGAKGMREGGIFIADFHGNLFVNDGAGTAADVRRLAAELKHRVRERFGIELEEEVRYF